MPGLRADQMPARRKEASSAKAKERGPRQTWLIITPEYPPQSGGVSDYTRVVAQGLVDTGDEVHVWGPRRAGGSGAPPGIVVHDELGDFWPSDLRRTGRALNMFPSPRRLLVQWVPHGYGFLSANVPFCLWLLARSLFREDDIEIVVHEPSLAFGEGSWRQDLVAVVHRLMTAILARAAQAVWVTIPAWETRWRFWTFGRRIPFRWLPVPNNIAVVPDTAAVNRIRRLYLPGQNLLLGHFGTYGVPIRILLEQVLPLILSRHQDVALVLIGNGSVEFRERLVAKVPWLVDRVYATGPLSGADVSRHLHACDLMLQPYPDGITTRRGSAMAALAHGVPMVSTVGKLTEEFWTQSDAVNVVPARDENALSEAVSRLINDRGERERLSLCSRELYSARFDVQHLIAALRGQN